MIALGVCSSLYVAITTVGGAFCLYAAWVWELLKRLEDAARGSPVSHRNLKVGNGDERKLPGTLNLYELIKCTCYKIGSPKNVCLQRLWVDPPEVGLFSILFTI